MTTQTSEGLFLNSDSSWPFTMYVGYLAAKDNSPHAQLSLLSDAVPVQEKDYLLFVKTHVTDKRCYTVASSCHYSSITISGKEKKKKSALIY